MIWDNLQNIIDSHQRFLISSHLSQDGDSIGSQLGMLWYLTSCGKEVVIYNYDPVPRKFNFLNNASAITSVKPDFNPDVLIILDCSNMQRLGWNAQEIAPVTINIDHHRDNTRFGAFNYVDDQAAATGAIIYRFFNDMHISYPPFVAEALYTAILTDTGGFRFSNTNSTILRICADLIDCGAHGAQIYEKVYSTFSPKALALQARIWSTLSYHLNGKVGCMKMPLKLLDELGAVYSDSEGMADRIITAEGVEVGVMIKYSENESHFSLRSKGTVDVGKIAQKIPGGGGHFSAAGCTISKPFDEAFSYMIEILRQEIG